MNEAGRNLDPITLEVLRNTLEATAQEMGAVLKLTAFSTNIKERMDASCAIFDSRARLVAQAEHVPVHMGSMLAAIGATLAAIDPLEEGDVIVVNDPFVAGAHLPDVLLVAPVHAQGVLIGYVAARAHHADVGGMEPGSMPGRSTEIFQEGIVIPPVLLYRKGKLRADIERMILANVRTPNERRGDLNAQLACLRIGERRLKELVEKFGAEFLAQGFESILDYSERRMMHRIAEIPAGTYSGEDSLDDDGTSPEPVRLRLTVTVGRERIVLDFAGSALQRRGNINAVGPMTHSAVYFALKVIMDPSIPANSGAFRPFDIRIPQGTVLNAMSPAAVCAGNTETTQRVADLVFKVFADIVPDRVPAASQGTMNLIGIGGRDPRSGRTYTYVETIAGGQGGRPMGHGQDGIQCNMTNTMNTPVEALEISYPLRVERYELREGSAGAGRNRGGMGVIRTIRIIGHDARVSIQSDRRVLRPYGLHGGADGKEGLNYVTDSQGRQTAQPGKTTLTLHAGDAITVESPGGGGWGADEETVSQERDSAA